MKNTLEVYGKIANPLEFAMRMGEAMARSRMFGVDTVEAGQVVALTCLCEGISPIEFQRTYHVIQGRPSMRADAMLAEFRNRGGDHKVIERSSAAAEIELIPKGRKKGDKFRLEWKTIENEPWTKDRNGDLKSNYATDNGREDMLWARVCSKAVRTVAPEIVAGSYTPEEVEEFEPVEAEPIEAVKIQSENVKLATPEEPSSDPMLPVEDQTPPAEPEQDSVSSTPMISWMAISELKGLAHQLGLSDEQLQSVVEKRGVSKLDELTEAQGEELRERLNSKLRNG